MIDIDDLGKIRTVRSAFVDASVGQLNTAIAVLTRFRDEILQAEEEKNKIALQRLEPKKEILKKMREYNLTSADLVDTSDVAPSAVNRRGPRGPVEPKYEYRDENGELCTWTGRGRTPVSFVKMLEKTGKKAEDFLIKK